MVFPVRKFLPFISKVLANWRDKKTPTTKTGLLVRLSSGILLLGFAPILILSLFLPTLFLFSVLFESLLFGVIAAVASIVLTNISLNFAESKPRVSAGIFTFFMVTSLLIVLGGLALILTAEVLELIIPASEEFKAAAKARSITR